jgi:primosomal protein N'
MKGFNDVEKEQQNFRRLTGQNADAFRGINDSLTTTSEYLAGMVTLTKELGVNANVAFSPETVTTVAELTANMGMAGKEAANLAALSKISGTNLQDNLKSTEGQFKNFVKTNKTALNFGSVLSGVANASDSVKLSLGGSQEALGKAVMEAQKLGLTLDQVDNIAGKLLDFQSSIEAEMEAELLTGQQINLEKARQFALDNDLAGLAKEIGNNQAVLQAFSTGNRIAQEATAKAMGMSREEMSKMILQQKIQEGLTTEQVAAAADISLEEAQRLTTQQQITKSIEKMSQALAPIIGFLLVYYQILGIIYNNS